MKRLILIGALSATLIGCGATAQKPSQQELKSTEQRQREAGIIPCTTDADCLQKNGDVWEHKGHWDAKIGDLKLVEFGSRAEAEQYIANHRDGAGASDEQCEAITQAGKRCSRKVPEAGLLCKQHSKMVKEGKEVKTVD